MKAHWFSNNDLRLRYGDGRQVKLGRTHKYEGPLELCNSGLHASTRLIDALKYAPGHHLWIVELSGDILMGDNKLCASERTYLQHLNCEKLFREFARKQALTNIEKIRPYTDHYDLIVNYLQTGDESIRSAARSAAESAAESAAWSAARSAAWSAVWSAARPAAESAAWSAAESAAWSAAESAAESAARSAARSAAESAAESAAWSAAESAAKSAARSAANKMLTQMVGAELAKKENL